MTTYFGFETIGSSDTSSIGCQWTTQTFACPGSGNQNIQELSVYISTNGNPLNIRLGVYTNGTPNSGTLVAEGTAEVAASQTAAWQGHMSQAAVKAAGGSSPGVLVGGTSYALMWGPDAASDSSHYVTSGGGYTYYAESTDPTPGCPSTLPDGATNWGDYQIAIRCGVDPSAYTVSIYSQITVSDVPTISKKTITNFGNENGSSTDVLSVYVVLIDPASSQATCPGSGSQVVASLGVHTDSATGNALCGIYDSTVDNVIAQGSSEIPALDGWCNHSSFHDVNGTPTTPILVGGTKYGLAATGDSSGLNFYYGSYGTSNKYRGGDWTDGFFNNPAINTDMGTEMAQIRCGVYAYTETYLFYETFEGSNECAVSGTNPNSCVSAADSFVVVGSPTTLNFGYTTGPLAGSKSLRIIGDATNEGVYVTVIQDHIYGFFEWKSISSLNGQDIMYITDSTGTTVFSLNVVGNSNFMVWVEDENTNHDTGVSVSYNTHYYIWYELSIGNPGTIKFWFSTTTTKPGSPSYSDTGADVDRFAYRHYFVTSSSIEHLFDSIYINNSDITGYPSGGTTAYLVVWGQQTPDHGETAVAWSTWSDGSGGAVTVTGDASWGKIKIESGKVGHSSVIDFGESTSWIITVENNHYGTGSGNVTTYYRYSESSFTQDAGSPSWNTYSSPTMQTCRYVQVKLEYSA